MPLIADDEQYNEGQYTPELGLDDFTAPPPTTPPASGPPPGDDPGGPYIEPWEISGPGAFEGSDSISTQFAGVPRFRAPRFTAPTAESVVNEPGYKLALEEGQRGLQHSQAARGILRTGGSLKDLASWSTNYAGTKYADAFNRALQAYGTDFNAAQAEYNPLLAEWQTLVAAQQRARELAFGREWDRYVFGADYAFRRSQAERADYLNTLDRGASL